MSLFQRRRRSGERQLKRQYRPGFRHSLYDSAFQSGAAYVFVRHGAAWSQQAYLKASNTEAADYFGGAVGLWGDTVVVGAWQEDSSATGVNGDQMSNGALRSGAAYLFTGVGLDPQPNLDIIPACYFIRFNGVPGFSYQLQRSPKVTGPWDTIATVTVPESGFVEYLDSKSPPGQAFYRAVQP